MLRKDKLWILCAGVVFLVFAYICTTPINLAVADLGRHITNGKIALQTKSFAQGNIYSFTFPDYPFLNHHWLSGVVFYLVHNLGGFEFLSVINTLTLTVTFLVFFVCAVRFGRRWSAILSAIVYLPLMGNRIEIRPEMFSALFAGVFFLILSFYQWRNLRRIWIFLLPFLTLIWVNLHIYFFLGFLLLGLFWLENLVESVKAKKINEKLRFLTLIGALMFVASLMNPGGFSGVLRPFQIYENYGYRVLEEQSVVFLQRVLPLPVLNYYYFSLSILALSWVFVFWKYRWKSLNIVWVGISVVFATLGLLMIRNFSLFGFFAMVVTSHSLKDFGLSIEKKTWWVRISILVVLFVMVFSINPDHWRSWEIKGGFGVGLQPEVDAGAKFLKENSIKGNIFNNYDIGGYLIYYLYPERQVFVDNRPDAYPAEFFRKYIHSQEDSESWRELSLQFNIEAIVFYRNDATPWGQKFLMSRVKDDAWIPVYIDNWVIVFVRKDGINRAQGERFGLPRELFRYQDGG